MRETSTFRKQGDEAFDLCNVPAQCTEYLDLNIRLASLTWRLSLFQLGNVVTFRLHVHLSGLIPSGNSVVHLGLLRLRCFLCWVVALHLTCAHVVTSAAVCR